MGIKTTHTHVLECWECGKQWADNRPLSKMCPFCLAHGEIHIVCNIEEQAHLMQSESALEAVDDRQLI